ncbi:MAG: glycosyltransferase family 2 protein [Lachnospiraceae bacterium]|nr:glycosyltransferase family 2 protein [Lachnospiraceae bacterium]
MRFSVVIPCYNSKDTIVKTVESVLAQTIKDFEIIVVNDGSTDDTDFDCLRKLGCLVLEQENGGVSRARNAGIKHANGDFICFLDSDDLWEKKHLEVLSKLIDKYPKCHFFCTSSVWLGVKGDFHPAMALSDYPEDFYCGNIFELLNSTRDSVIHTDCVCLRKTFIMENSLFFAEGVKNAEDSDMWLRCGVLSGIVISQKETALYLQKNSHASLGVSFVDNWVFLKRLEGIYNGKFSEEIKTACYKYMDRYFLFGSRYFAAKGDKKRGFELLKKVKYRNGKKYILTFLFILLPAFISSKFA